MKIGCCSVAFRRYGLELALEKISQAGFEYVEVEANLSWCPHADPWKDDPLKFREKIESYGLKCAGLGSHRELITQEQGLRDIEQALNWAGAAGVPLVITGEGRMPEGLTREQTLEILQPRLERLTATAGKNKVYLAMEDHGSISLSPDGLPRILALVDSPWLAVNFDTANIHRGDYVGTDRNGYEWKLGAKTSYSETELLSKVVRKVRHLHFKDVRGRTAVVLGRGEIDLKGCLKILATADFQGVLSYQTEGWEEPEEAMTMIVQSRQWMIEALQELEA
ncbi:MAG: sugar phosphate isomerase/epimerase [Thermodesulfobacteriota bacterium]